MPDWLLDRSTVIGLAIVGGVFSIVASWCQVRGIVSEDSIKKLNQTAYAFMAVSIILFVIAGLTGAD